MCPSLQWTWPMSLTSLRYRFLCVLMVVQSQKLNPYSSPPHLTHSDTVALKHFYVNLNHRRSTNECICRRLKGFWIQDSSKTQYPIYKLTSSQQIGPQILIYSMVSSFFRVLCNDSDNICDYKYIRTCYMYGCLLLFIFTFC